VSRLLRVYSNRLNGSMFDLVLSALWTSREDRRIRTYGVVDAFT
jgi:hypothetical protein